MSRTPILVKFPAELLADIDAEAASRGLSRTAIILERCRQEIIEIVPPGYDPKTGETRPPRYAFAPRPSDDQLLDEARTRLGIAPKGVRGFSALGGETIKYEDGPVVLPVKPAKGKR